MKTNLILVDGICGSGKSTLSQLLCLNLVERGVRARWVYEHENLHPIFDENTIADLASGKLRRGLYRRALGNWKKLAAALEGTREVVIIESVLFQVYVGMPLLLGMQKEQITEHVRQVEKAIRKLNPQLLYLCQDNVPVAIERICEARGDWFRDLLVQRLAMAPRGQWRGARGFKGVQKYFQDLRALTDALVDGLVGIPTLRVDNSDGDYARCNREVAACLGLKKLSWPHPAVRNIAGLCGSFQADTSEDVLQISSDGKDLFLGQPGGMRLIPLTSKRFLVQGMCMEILFRTRRDGTAKWMECSGNLPGLCLKWLKK